MEEDDISEGRWVGEVLVAEARRWMERAMCGAGRLGARDGDGGADWGFGVGAAQGRWGAHGWMGMDGDRQGDFLDGNPVWGPQNSPKCLHFAQNFKAPKC
jgi:hypothetical protein